MTKDEALKTALDWYRSGHEDIAEFQAMIESILAQPKQEPVAHFGSAYINKNGVHVTTVLGPAAIPQDAKIYTSLPPKCQPLTDEQIWQLVDGTKGSVTAFARALEAKLKEKNT